MRGKKKIPWIVAVVVLVAAVLAYAFWPSKRDADTGTATTIVVAKGSLVETASASGTIEPRVQVEVKSRLAGTVTHVLVSEGDAVAVGDLLFRLDPVDATRTVAEARAGVRQSAAELAQARANLAVAETQADDARTTREVRARGSELGLVSAEEDRTANRELTVADTNVQLRRAQIQASSAGLASARLNVADAERRLAETEIRAPIAGTVLSVDVEVGSIVPSAVTNVGGGTALVTLADLTNLRVIGLIDEAQIGRVAVGQAVAIRVDAYPDRIFTGRVDRVSPLGREESNVVTFEVEVEVTDADKNLLRSGMSADLEIETSRLTDVLLVPLEAIQTSAGRRTVRLQSGESRAIRTGASDGRHIVVLSGLREGDRLLVGVTTGEPASSSSSPLSFGPPRRPGSSGSSRPSGGPR